MANPQNILIKIKVTKEEGDMQPNPQRKIKVNKI
jgi:hypothetical protein